MYHVIAKTNPDTGLTVYFATEATPNDFGWTMDRAQARHWTDYGMAEKALKNLGVEGAEVVGVVM